jgi:hypothetical protein
LRLRVEHALEHSLIRLAEFKLFKHSSFRRFVGTANAVELDAHVRAFHSKLVSPSELAAGAALCGASRIEHANNDGDSPVVRCVVHLNQFLSLTSITDDSLWRV